MAHHYTEMQSQFRRTVDILRIALSSAEDAERHAHNAGVISPSPAQATVLRQAVAMALSIALMHDKGTRFDLDDVPFAEPLPGSYIEGWMDKQKANTGGNT